MDRQTVHDRTNALTPPLPSDTNNEHDEEHDD